MSHIYHVYENLVLTFGEIKDILEKVSNNQLKVYEKTDGQNILLSYSLKEKKALSARTKNDILKGGLTAKEMSERFYENSKIKKTFFDAVKTWESAISLVSAEKLYQIFGYDADIYYNCEIQDPSSRNVINYDRKYIVIHPDGHLEIDKITKEPITRNFSNNLETLRNALDEVEAKNSGFDYKLISKTIYDLKNTLDKKHYNDSISKIDDLIKKYDLKDSNNIYDLCIAKTGELLSSVAPNMESYVRYELTKKIIGIPIESNINTLLKSLPKLEREKVKNIIAKSDKVKRECVEQLEEIIHEFSVNLLSGLKSLYILDNDSEVKRIKSKLEDAIQKIKKSNDFDSMSILYKQLKKLKNVDRIDTAIEGLVFDYRGKVYKLTGNFAPVNQILGLLTYGKVNFGRTIDYSPDGNIVVFPGKFKPPHLGHFMGVKELSAIKQIDKIVVLISPKEQDGISAEMSKKIWEIYKKYEPKIEVEVTDENSPVTATFGVLRVTNNKTKVFLTLSEKELEDGTDRFKDVNNFVNKYNPGLKVEIIYTEQNKEGINGSYVRELIINGKKDMFFSVLPKELSLDDREEIWRIVSDKELSISDSDIKTIVREAVVPVIFRTGRKI